MIYNSGLEKTKKQSFLFKCVCIGCEVQKVVFINQSARKLKL